MSAIQVQLHEVHTPTFDPFLGINFSDYSCWSDRAKRVFAGFSALSQGSVDEGLEILGGNADNQLHQFTDDSSAFTNLAHRHYYASTALVSLVESSRKHIEVDVSNFVWMLKDNPYAFEVISSVRGMFYSIEGACAFAHHSAEVKAGHAIAEPQIDRAKDLYLRRPSRTLRLIALQESVK